MGSTSARIVLVAFALVLVTVSLVVVHVKAPNSVPAPELWLLALILALPGTAWAQSRAFMSVEPRAKRIIVRVATSIIVWLAFVLGAYIVAANLKLALEASNLRGFSPPLPVERHQLDPETLGLGLQQLGREIRS